MFMQDRRPLPENGRYFEYLRKSRDEMRQEKLYGGDVLAKHAMLLDYTAQVNGHAVGHVFREVVSGETIADRPQMREVIAQVKELRWDGVYVMAVDRLSRGSQQDQGVVLDLLEHSGLFVITPNGYYDPWNPNDYDSIRYQLFSSNGEFRAYSRRMHDSIKTSVMQGQFIGCYVPFGYDKAVLDNGFKTLRPNDDAKYVGMMFEWAGNDDLSLYAISRRLTAMGVKPPRGPEGREWSPTTIGEILHNEVYVGVAKWGKHKTVKSFSTDAMERHKSRKVTDEYTTGEGEWPPLVTRELFDLVAVRRSGRIPLRGDGQLANLFANLMVCSDCGRAMAVLNDRCGKRIAHKSGMKCKMKGAYERFVVDAFVDALRGKLDDMEVDCGSRRAKAERERDEQAVANLERQIAKIDERARFLLTMRANQEITAEEYAAARMDAASEREAACDRLEDARARLAREVDCAALSATIHQAIGMLRDDSVTVQAKNLFLRTFIKQVRYTNRSSYGKNDLMELEVVFL